MLSRAASLLASAPAALSHASARPLSVLSSHPFPVAEEAFAFFGRAARGLDTDLNQSLAADGLTTRGEAYRNAPVRDLLEFAERGSVRVTKGRALEVTGGPLAVALKTTAFATDALPGAKVMDVEEFEGRLASVRDECLSFAPRLFVEDAALGSSRASEVRVRVVSDSPILALHFRAMLHRTPLYNPQAFPRTITLYAATLARASTGAGRGMSAPFTVVDADPARQRCHVLAVGPVSLAALTEALATAAAALQGGAGGYRSVPGGAHNPGLAEARAEGVLPWYMRDGHVYAAPGEAHPALLPVRGALVAAGAAGATTLVLGCTGGSLEGSAARAGRLLAGHHCVLELGAGGRGVAVASQWAGAHVRGGSGSDSVRGALIAQGGVSLPLSSPSRLFAAPGRVLVVGAAAAAGGLSEAGVAKLQAAVGGSASVAVVGSEEEASKALGL